MGNPALKKMIFPATNLHFRGFSSFPVEWELKWPGQVATTFMNVQRHLVCIPIGSMYGIYANIGGILMVNVTIYSIYGSYGIVFGHSKSPLGGV
jgi:hypothetical protein